MLYTEIQDAFYENDLKIILPRYLLPTKHIYRVSQKNGISDFTFYIDFILRFSMRINKINASFFYFTEYVHFDKASLQIFAFKSLFFI